MRSLLLGVVATAFFLMVFIPPAVAEEEIIDKVEKRAGIIYKPGADTPYTGQYNTRNEETGTVVEIHIQEGKIDGDYIERYANGHKKMHSHWKGGRQNGLLTFWDEEEHKLIESEMKDGVPHGMERMWNNDGSPRSEAHYTEGKIDGMATEWHPNGQKSLEAHFSDGKQHGRSVSWYANGQKQAEGYYRNDLEHGTVTTWDPAGNQLEQTEFINGVPQQNLSPR